MKRMLRSYRYFRAGGHTIRYAVRMARLGA